MHGRQLLDGKTSLLNRQLFQIKIFNNKEIGMINISGSDTNLTSFLQVNDSADKYDENNSLH